MPKVTQRVVLSQVQRVLKVRAAHGALGVVRPGSYFDVGLNFGVNTSFSHLCS